jgi:hypothetical protein
MYWMIVGLVVLGAACGTFLRLLIFIGVLLGAAVIAAAVSLAYGGGVSASLLNVLIAVIALQVGYGAGVVLGAAIRSSHMRTAARSAPARPVASPLGEKRQ